jgi:hypothetical protein
MTQEAARMAGAALRSVGMERMECERNPFGKESGKKLPDNRIGKS